MISAQCWSCYTWHEGHGDADVAPQTSSEQSCSGGRAGRVDVVVLQPHRPAGQTVDVRSDEGRGGVGEANISVALVIRQSNK